jgi:hypothetical protein
VAERELVEAYLEGRIGVWGLFRRLTKLGMATATALAVALSMPAAVNSKDFSGMEEAKARAEAEDRMAIDRIVALLAAQLERAQMDTSLAPLSVTLARIGANNLSAMGGEAVPFSFRGDNISFTGALTPSRDESGPNLNLALTGTVGQMGLDLRGDIDPPPETPPPEGDRPVQLGGYNLRFVGMVGDVPLNFEGHIGNIETFRIIPPDPN